MATTLFYKPQGAYAADFIPFYHEGRFYLFYLHDWRQPEVKGEGTPWHLISTTDFVHFDDHGEVLPRGTQEDQDLYVFTGSVVAHAGRFHIFYTGHNPHLMKQGRPQEAIMHAVSDDLVHWTKLPARALYAPTASYEPHDWRDPFVFWNAEAGEYWMLLAARLTHGPSRQRGCTALCTSKDLETWQVREPFWAPGLYSTHECPDLFRWGDWWYLVFSEFSHGSLTRYRMSRSLHGPWVAPADDAFDGRAFYAAKTASDGAHRYLFGWVATRARDSDEGHWEWGGNLVVHELWQREDGTLGVRPPQPVLSAFPLINRATLRQCLGTLKCDGPQYTLVAPGALQGRWPNYSWPARTTSAFAWATGGALPDCCLIRARVTFSEGTRACGLLLRTTDDLEQGYSIRLEPDRRRLVLDRWPRPGDQPFVQGLERPLPLEAGKPVDFQVVVDGNVCVVYVAGSVAMTARMYAKGGSSWGVFVQEGSASFRDTFVATQC
jgi:beta-fructofuranosidase